jgi:hypothetical protein
MDEHPRPCLSKTGRDKDGPLSEIILLRRGGPAPLAANENTGFFLGMLKPQPGDISNVVCQRALFS